MFFILISRLIFFFFVLDSVATVVGSRYWLLVSFLVLFGSRKDEEDKVTKWGFTDG